MRAVPGLPALDRTTVMGVVNVTPDSFSDGGEWLDPAAAVTHGLQLIAEGADIVDVGGESTRPGAVRPEVTDEIRRVVPVIRALTEAGACVSVDTMRPVVAEQAVAAGARLVNDVSGGLADPDMIGLVASLGVPYLCMHWRGHAEDMQSRAVYVDVVADVVTEVQEQIRRALEGGIAADKLIVDPGFGFAKTGEHNWQLLQRLEELAVLDLPLLIGVSRKTFLGTLLADPDRTGPRPPRERDDATTALTALLATGRPGDPQGIGPGSGPVWGVRVHSVRASRDAVAVATRLRRI